jgi:hypothetical protein
MNVLFYKKNKAAFYADGYEDFEHFNKRSEIV